MIPYAAIMNDMETSGSIFELVNMAAKEALSEDAEDITVFEDRANEPIMGFS